MNSRISVFCPNLRKHEQHRWGVDSVYCPGVRTGLVKQMVEWQTEHCGEYIGHIPHRYMRGVKARFCPGTKAYKPTAEDYELAEEFAAEHNASEQKPSTEVVKWADEAMFKAEPIRPEDGPQVYILWMTPDPLGAIAAACKMYKGEVVRDLSTVTDVERLEYFAQVQKTKLKAPFEFVKFHFMIEGVTRAFTHQMVRQRTAAYAQESLRFAVIGEEDGNIPVRLPPSLSGLPEDSRERRIWDANVSDIGAAYRELVEAGVPAEDARGLLPHNVLTRLHYTTDLRALLDHAGNRLCTQAQFEWRLVFAKIIEAIRERSVGIDGVARPDGMRFVYMASELLDAFKPVCFQTGKCEFKANFDRHCNIRERVDANEREGRPSSEWDQDQVCHPLGCDNPEVEIEGIKPGEWLLDPGAARKRQR